MAAYLLLDIEVHDPVRYEEYKKIGPPTLAAFGGRYVVRGGPVQVLEGSHNGGRVVVIEFPSAAQARAWWDSDAYRPGRILRQESATTSMILVEGV